MEMKKLHVFSIIITQKETSNFMDEKAFFEYLSKLLKVLAPDAK
jgi:hypothetical protein